ncbi:hypothetical protein F4680DRAFT_448226 [Xylaria scruposa]|nr:hypothetical protein F4680DRAFT_448226 [Xylaria scruposa]
MPSLTSEIVQLMNAAEQIENYCHDSSNYVDNSEQIIRNRLERVVTEMNEYLKLVDELQQMLETRSEQISQQSRHNHSSKNSEITEEFKQKIETRSSSIRNQCSENLELVKEFRQTMETRSKHFFEQLTQLQSSVNLECARESEDLMWTLSEKLIQDYNSNVLEIQYWCFDVLRFMEESKQKTATKASLVELVIQEQISCNLKLDACCSLLIAAFASMTSEDDDPLQRDGARDIDSLPGCL